MSLRIEEGRKIYEELARLRELLTQSMLSQRSHHYQNSAIGGNSQVHQGDIYRDFHQHLHHHYHQSQQCQQSQQLTTSRGFNVASQSSPHVHRFKVFEFDSENRRNDTQIHTCLDRLFVLSRNSEGRLSPSQTRSSIKDLSTILRYFCSSDNTSSTTCTIHASEDSDRILSVIQLTQFIQTECTKNSMILPNIPPVCISSPQTDARLGLQEALSSDTTIHSSSYKILSRNNQAATYSMTSTRIGYVTEHSSHTRWPINDEYSTLTYPVLSSRLRRRKKRHVRDFTVMDLVQQMSNITVSSLDDTSRYNKVTRVVSWKTENARLDLIIDEKKRHNLCDCGQQYHMQHEAFSVAIFLTPTNNPQLDQQLRFRFQQNSKCTSASVLPSSLEIRNLRSSDSEIFRIAGSGSVDDMNHLLASGQGSLKDCNEIGVSLLGHALSYYNVEMVRFLLSNGADVDAIEPWLVYPEEFHSIFRQLDMLHATADRRQRENSMECIKLMLQFATDPVSYQYDGSITIARKIIEDCTIETVRALLDHGYPFVTPNSIMGTKQSPLFLLVKAHADDGWWLYQIPDKIALFLQRGSDVNAHDVHGDSYIHVVMEYDYPNRHKFYKNRVYQNPVSSEYDGELKDILMLLITAGADVYARNNLGESPSDIADATDHWQEWTDALTECGYYPDEVNVSAEEVESTCWTSATDRGTRNVQPKRLSFAAYLEIRKGRLGEFERNELIEVDDSEFGSEYVTNEDSDIPEALETESTDWVQDNHWNAMDTNGEQLEPQDDLDTADDEARLEAPSRCLKEKSD